MGIFKKLKDILFDEEEYTEQIKITPEMRNEQTPVKAKEEKKVPVQRSEVEVKPPVQKMEMPKEAAREVKEERPVSKPSPAPVSAPSGRETFKSERTFPFVDFDEEKFSRQIDPMRVTSSVSLNKEEVPKRSTNVIEYERRKRVEKRTDYGKFEKIESSETIEKRKFKPSPIISPVYGILDKDYTKEDIVQKSDVKPSQVDIKEVREKAFGENKSSIIKPKKNGYEEEKTVTLTPIEEKKRKVKTIDELLEDTSDVTIDVKKDFDDYVDDEPPRLAHRKDINKEKLHDTKEMKMDEDNTLESDLFDLIDSMYDSKEDGD